MALKWDPKDPDEILDYSFDWTPRLETGDEIATTEADVVEGDVVIQAHDKTVSGTGTVTWLVEGTNGTKCRIRIRVTTVGGRVMDDTVSIAIKTR